MLLNIFLVTKTSLASVCGFPLEFTCLLCHDEMGNVLCFCMTVKWDCDFFLKL